MFLLLLLNNSQFIKIVFQKLFIFIFQSIGYISIHRLLFLHLFD